LHATLEVNHSQEIFVTGGMVLGHIFFFEGTDPKPMKFLNHFSYYMLKCYLCYNKVQLKRSSTLLLMITIV